MNETSRGWFYNEREHSIIGGCQPAAWGVGASQSNNEICSGCACIPPLPCMRPRLQAEKSYLSDEAGSLSTPSLTKTSWEYGDLLKDISLQPQYISNSCVNVNGWQYSSVSHSKWTQKWDGLYLVLLEQMFCFIRLGHAVSCFECVFMGRP